MNWLITLSKDADVSKISKSIVSIGGEINLNFPDNLAAGDDLVISVKGPENFREKVRKIKGVLEIYPDSDVMLY